MVVKAKNRFLTPAPNGYRDFNLHFELAFVAAGAGAGAGAAAAMEVEQRHTCEVQVHLRAVKEFSDRNDGQWILQTLRLLLTRGHW